MKVLLGHCMPHPFSRLLIGHEVKTARAQGWDKLKNGALLTAAGTVFGALVTVDTNLRKQQNLSTLPLPVILIEAVDNQIETIAPCADEVLRLLSTRLQRRVYIVSV